MRLTYNGIRIPERVPTKLLISAFCNAIEEEKVSAYSEVMRCGECFPPIAGYPTEIDESDLGDYFMNGMPIEECHFGMIAWKTTDGHHRSLAAIRAGTPFIDTEIDPSCFTVEAELAAYRAVV